MTAQGTPVETDDVDEQRTALARAWAWATRSRQREFAVGAVLLAFIRLLSVSHVDLATARALLQHGDLTELAGGLVLSAALLWLPILAGFVTHGGLSFVASTNGGRMRSLILSAVISVVGFAGTVSFFQWFGVDVSDINEVARGGLRLGFVAMLAGSGGGAALFGLAASVQELKQVGTDAESPQGERGAGADESDVSSVEPGERTVDVEPRRGTGSLLRLPGKAGEVVGRVLIVLFVGLLAVWLMLVVLIIAVAVLTEPSQPPENLTVAEHGESVTRTVHVIDDSDDYWVVMVRDGRRIMTIDEADVRDRYICRAAFMSSRETDAVTAKTVEPLRAGTAEPPDGDRVYGAAKVRRRGEELDNDVLRSAAERWVEQMEQQPPPCQPEWSSTEVAAVRLDLGLVCDALGRCERLADDDVAEP